MTNRHPKNSLRGSARANIPEILLSLFAQDQFTLQMALTLLEEVIPSPVLGIFSIFITHSLIFFQTHKGEV